MLNLKFLLLLFCVWIATTDAGTSIQVKSEYIKEVNVKIQGAGVGGCDVILQPGSENPSDCWCLWGTLNYSFCAYTKTPFLGNSSQTLADGRCPKITGESLLCSDVESLGNCYKGPYSCFITSDGACSCQ